MTPSNFSTSLLLAFVGMPGAGKSAVVSYVQKKGFPFVRFGDVTEEELKKQGLPLNPENEKKVREELRNTYGMHVYAARSLPAIDALMKNQGLCMIDGLYSWEEYKLLKEKFPQIKLVFVFAEAEVRYARLAKRAVRPLTHEEAEARDIAEIENIHKSGPIARADFLLDNNGTLDELFVQIDTLLERLKVQHI